MLTSQNALRREIGGNAYVCLSCRLKTRASLQPPPSTNQPIAPGRGHEGRRGFGTRASTGKYNRCTTSWDGQRGQRLRDGGLRRRNINGSQRGYHASPASKQPVAAAVAQDAGGPPSDIGGLHAHNALKTGGIRDQLRQWQELHGKDLDEQYKVLEQTNDTPDGESPNFTRLHDPSMSLRLEAEREEEEQRSIAHFSRTEEMDDGSTLDNRFLKMGDLIELDFNRSERESIIAVFVRRTFSGSQVFTMHGRWMIIPERSVQYSIPKWISPKLVEPMIKFLPDPKDLAEADELAERAYIEDLSVPRAVAAPLVSRMLQFNTESLEIYRKHSRALDNAHAILAHESDLRYGSLVSAATTLLKTPAAELPVTALFTVRKALSNAGFAFNIDPRSHRLTGYLQIRSKEQCRMLDRVRQWLREWQDDMAARASIQGDERAMRRHKVTEGAEIVYSFLEKARNIVHKARESREPTICGTVGPSKKRFPITPTSDAIRTETKVEFSDQDTELVRFMESWACSNMFTGLPRIEALPPLLLQATGLYDDYDLRTPTGFLFLQELGTLMPWENRVRFDQHLLLPSSQHSRPLQALMTTLMDMQDKHNFQDAMADLRHDWGDLPVFCIDDASAHEIDDGLSVESAGDGQWWVRIHIANPTAFFNRDHALAKMARHMGESIYMPERTYMMLPRWATKRHFSLDKDRPALTFSVKMDSEGRTLNHKIQPGFIRKVLRLTHPEVVEIVGGKTEAKKDESDLKTVTVGGQPPLPKEHKSMMPRVTDAMKEQLQVLHRLASKRKDLREAAGGVFFDLHKPDVTVYQGAKGPGLAWDHPFRQGSRTVEGDPVIKLSSKGFKNWFTPGQDLAVILVREMMLLACETAAKWCAERQIPTIYRGVAPTPDQPDADEYLRNTLLPAAAKTPTGEYPMHLAVPYLQMLGHGALSTRPLYHKALGMEFYGKVTSPLRRYGDMILHWQIEGALREEARTGRSLVTDNKKADRSFLPFSANVLETIMLGLQPREKIILRAKSYADHFWFAQLLFRAFHYGEAKIPWTPTDEAPLTYAETPTAINSGLLDGISATNKAAAMTPGQISMRARPPPPPQNYLCHTFISSAFNGSPSGVGCMNVELNVPMMMERPEKFGLPEVKPGDVWECNVLLVDVYRRNTFVRPRRLVHRAEE